MSAEPEDLEHHDEPTQQEEAKAIKHIDDGSDRSITSKARARQILEEQIQCFLRNGGAVVDVAHDVINDPPRRPVSNYGSRPI
jgi:hypothetical protein